MADKHTPEPWEIGTQTRGSEICTIHGVTRRPSDDGCGQGWVYIHYPRVIDGKYHYPDEAENDANARRIVACVNALKGFSTEAIEAGGVQELLRTLTRISTLRPAGDVATATNTRALVQQMEAMALTALSKWEASK